MTDQNQLLREALQDIEQAHDLSLDLDHYAGRQVLVSLADKIKVALAQTAEGGEVVAPLVPAPAHTCWGRAEKHLINSCTAYYTHEQLIAYAKQYAAWHGSLTTPPASQEQEQQPEKRMVPIEAVHEVERERDYWRTRAKTMIDHANGEFWGWQGDGEDHLESMANSMPVVIRADQLRELQAQQPSTQAWANETGLRQIECPSCGDLAVAYDPQQPSGEVVLPEDLPQACATIAHLLRHDATWDNNAQTPYVQWPEPMTKEAALTWAEVIGQAAERLQASHKPETASDDLIRRLNASIAWLERGESLPGSSACIGLNDIKAIRAILTASRGQAKGGA